MPQLRADAGTAWQITCRNAGIEATDQAAETFEDLFTRYAEPGRHYHTMRHILSVLSAVRDPAIHLQNPDLAVAELAAWFHDAVYDTTSDDNEQQSAGLATQSLNELGVDEATGDRVARLILLTAGHENNLNDRAATVFLDADLIILAAPMPEYSRYAKAIREEYDWVQQDVYEDARIKTLENFLKRERIFAHPAHYHLEDRARRNLRSEIESLQRTGSAE